MGVFFKKNQQKGFTLIEVVLVLAIAGVIFLIVFLAVQAANKGKNDTQAKSAASRLLAAAEQYASNNNGDYPSTANGCTALASYWSGGGYVCNNSATQNKDNPKIIKYNNTNGVVTITYYSSTKDGTDIIQN